MAVAGEPTVLRGGVWILPALFVVLVALHLLPGLTADVWQDEASTLLQYASKGFWYPFTDYSTPNNHMLFSAVLSQWWSRGDSVTHLRLLPAAMMLLSVVGLYGLGVRLVGRLGATLALALFCASSITLAFALSLRGYAFSWPFSLLLLASAMSWVRDGRRTAGLVFVAASVANVLILPSNAFLGPLALVWPLFGSTAPADGGIGGAWRRAGLAGVASLLGLLLYLPHAAAMAAHARHGFSDWTDLALAGHWLLATFGNFWPVLPVLILGMLPKVGAHASTAAGPEDAAPRVLGMMALVLALTLILLPVAIFPRTLVPCLPLWYLAIGGVLARGVQRLAGAWPGAPARLAILAALLVFGIGVSLRPCAGFISTTPGTHDLCQQFYLREYRPLLLLRAVEARFGSTNPRIVLDDEAALALGFAYWNQPRQALRLIHWRNWSPPGDIPNLPEYAISDGVPGTMRMLQTLHLGAPRAVQLVLDSGYFKLYKLDWH